MQLLSTACTHVCCLPAKDFVLLWPLLFKLEAAFAVMLYKEDAASAAGVVEDVSGVWSLTMQD